METRGHKRNNDKRLKREEQQHTANDTQPTQSNKKPRKTEKPLSKKEEKKKRSLPETSIITPSEKVGEGTPVTEKKEKHRKDRRKCQGMDPDKRSDKAPMGSDDKDEDEEFPDAFALQRNLASAGSALQGLLRRLGAGIDDLVPGGPSLDPRFRGLLSGLKAEGDEGRQLESLSELCNILSMGTEESMASFSLDQFVPVLIGLMSYEHNPDMMLLAARVLTHVIDALPAAGATVVHLGAVPIFCARLLSIEYIDLAEQCLQALEKLSHEHHNALLKNGALMASLMFLDFFSTGVQRVAASTASNICRQVPGEMFDMVVDAIPILTNLVVSHDAKLVEHSCLAIVRLSDSFSHSTDKLETLASFGLTKNLVSQLDTKDENSSISPSTYSTIVRLLATLCHGSATIATSLHVEGISSTIRKNLSGQTTTAKLFSPNSPMCSSERLVGILSLASGLLPPIQMPAEYGTVIKPGCFKALEDMNQADKSRFEMVKAHPDFVAKMTEDLIDLLLHVYTSSVNSSVKARCVNVILKMVCYGATESLRVILKDTPLSSFVAELLTSKDGNTVICALHMCEALMEKLPEIYSVYFVREGVVNEIDRLCSDKTTVYTGLTADIETPSKKNLGKLLEEEASKTKKRPPSGSSGRPLPAKRDGTPSSSSRPNSAPKDKAESSPAAKAQVYRNIISIIANRLRENHFKSGGAGGCLDSPVVRRLQAICDALSNHSSAISTLNPSCPLDKPFAEYEDIKALIELKDLLVDTQGVSTYEFVCSGVIKTLLAFLAVESDGAQKSSLSSGVPERVLFRLKAFLTVMAGTETSQEDSPLRTFVRKLHEVLGSVERFPMSLNDSAGDGMPGLRVLTHPFKLRLQRHAEEKNLSDFSSHFVLIEPLASVNAISEFLWPKVNGADGRAGGEQADEEDEASASEQKRGARRLRSAAPAKEHLPIREQEGQGSSSRHGQESNRSSRGDMSDLMSNEDEDFSSDYYGMEEDELMDDEEIDEEEIMDENGPEDDDEDDVDDDDDVYQGDRRKKDDVVDFRLEERRRRDSLTSGLQDREKDREKTKPGTSSNAGGRDGPAGPAHSSAPKLTLVLNGHELPPNIPIFQAVQRYGQRQLREDAGVDDQAQHSRHRLTLEVVDIKYKKASPDALSQRANGARKIGESSVSVASTLKDVLTAHLPCDLSHEDPAYDTLALLRLLWTICDRYGEIVGDNLQLGKVLSTIDFTNNKMTAKLGRQLQDALSLCSGGLPSWCGQLASTCRFLFPLESRRDLFYSTAFGVSRALHRLQSRAQRETTERAGFRLGRIQRQKVRIARGRILESAYKVMELYAGSMAVLEVEYFGEVGTGLGPTLEFYTTTSRHLQRKGKGLWLHDTEKPANEQPVAKTAIVRSVEGEATSDEDTKVSLSIPDSELVNAPSGLFPAPVAPGFETTKAGERLIEHFVFMGRFLGKAMLDNRLVDLPLSVPMIKTMLGRPLVMDDMEYVDPQLLQTLRQLSSLGDQYAALSADTNMSDTQKTDAVKSLQDTVEGMCLSFTAPGFPDIELKPDGAEVDVTIHNVSEFVELVVKCFLGTGIDVQIKAFRTGFADVFSLDSLCVFNEHELQGLICGVVEAWDVKYILDTIKCDHGYTKDSEAIVFLADIMCEMSDKEKREWLKFLTGTPKLPVGGLSRLSPQLTVVRKHPEDNRSPDEYLPSVMTCANYLKLPNYSTKEIMRKRIHTAMAEGQGSFHLS